MPAAAAVLLAIGSGASLQGQQATFNGAVSTLGSGFLEPGGVAVDHAGNLYVADYANNAVKEIVAGTGGASAGTVNANSTVNTIGSNFNGPEGVAVDQAGNVYVADYGNSAVKEIVAGTGGASAGTVNASSTVNNVGSGFSSPQSVAVDRAGNVYVADSNSNAVKEIVAGTGGASAGTVNANSTVNTIGSNFNGPTGVAVDQAGNVYVVDYGNNPVKEIVAGTGGASAGTVNANSTVNTIGSGFNGPEGVAVDQAGNVYVADYGNSAVKEIVAGTGGASAGTVNAGSTVNTIGSGFKRPLGVAVDQAGNVYVADTSNNAVKDIELSAPNFGSIAIGVANPPTIEVSFLFNANVTLGGIAVLTKGAQNLDFTSAGTGACALSTAYTAGQTCTVGVKFSPRYPGVRLGAVVLTDSTGTIIATVHVNGTGTGSAVAFPTNTSTTLLGSGFSYPDAVALDGAGNLYISDLNNNTVSEIAANSHTVTTLVRNVQGCIGAAVDGAGNVYYSENTLSLVHEILAGTGGAAPGTVNSSSTVITLGSTFNQPTGLAVDGAGNVYVADDKNNAVKEVMAGTGGAAPGTVNANSTVHTIGSGFRDPYNVAVDEAGNVFVADAGNNEIKEILAGTGGAAAGTVNSNSTVNTLYGGFGFPQGVAVDAAGNVYAADNGNNAVKEILAGTGGAAPGMVNTSSTMVLLGTGFAGPVSVAVDGAGNVYATDSAHGEIKEIPLASPPSLTFPSTGEGTTSSPQTLTVQNIGNSNLIFPVPATGDNPDVPAGFGLSNLTNCPTVTASSSSDGILAGGTTCDLQIDFVPTTTGTISGNIVLTDNNLNSANSTQSIPVSGTGVSSGTGIIEPVGSTSTTQTAGITFSSNFTLGKIYALTQGLTGLDFNLVSGGTCTINTAYTSGQSCKVQYSFTPTVPGIRPGAIVLYDTSGNLVSTQYISGIGQGPILAYGPPTVSILQNTTPPLGNPEEITFDSIGNLYVANLGTGTVLKFPVTGTGTFGTPLTVTSALVQPGAVAVDGAGNVFIADYGTGPGSRSGVYEVPWNSITSTYGAPIALYSGTWDQPNGIALDYKNNLYVADSDNFRVIKMPWNGSSYGLPVDLTSGVVKSPAISHTDGVAVDAKLNVFIADTQNNRIVELPWNGTGYSTPVVVDGNLNYPFTLAVDSAGDLYVTDTNNYQVIELPVSGTGFGAPIIKSAQIYAGVQMTNVTGVAIDPSGNVYLSDDHNNRIIRLGYSTASAKTLNFPTATNVGQPDTADDPQTVSLQNIGNQPLTLTLADSGTDPALSSGFSLDASNTCATLNSAGTSDLLQVGATCNYAIDFTPTAGGANTGALNINGLNLSGAAANQAISLSGTGISLVAQLAFTGAPPATLTAGGNAGSSITVTEEDASANAVSSGTDTITLSVTGPSGYSKTYTATAVNGVATFNLSGASLTAAGPYTYTASISGNSSVTNGIADETVAAASVAHANATLGGSQSAIIGAAFSTALQVQTTDAYSNPIGGVMVTFTPPATGASATLSAASCTTSTTSPIGVCSVTATANGTASSTPYTITAKAAGVTAGAVFSLTNLKATPTVTLSEQSSSLVYGQPESVTASFAPASVAGTSPSTGILFYDNGSLLNAALVSSGSATLSNLHAAVGTHTYTAAFSGDSNFNASATATATPNVVVSKASATLQGPTSQPVELTQGTSGSIAIHVAGQYSGTGIASPTGSISYTIGGVVGTAAISNGAATIPVPNTLSPNTYTIAITYSGDANYNAATPINVSLQVNQIAQTITFTAPASPVTYGVAPITLTAASTSNLVVSFSVVSGPGSVSGNQLTVTGAGTIVVAASQSGNTDYSAAPKVMQTIVVNKATPIIAWAKPASITYGTPLGATQLNASATGVGGASLAGAYTYSPAAGTVLTAMGPGVIQSLGVVFTPTDTADYTTAQDAVGITVNQAAPVLTWSAPAAIPYGVPLGAAQLDATVKGVNGVTLPGTSVYSPGPGSYLTPGAQALHVAFTPTDTVDYSALNGSTTLTVNKASVTLTAQSPSLSLNNGHSGVVTVVASGQYSGTSIALPSGAVSYTILNASSASVASGTVTLASGAASVPVANTLSPGQYSIHVTYGGDSNYAAATSPAVVGLVVSQIQPTITWAQPAAITYGASLGGALNATAMNGTAVVPGTMAYTVTAAGQSTSSATAALVLPAGMYTLGVTFTPTDTTTYKTATASVSLVVNKATAGISLTASASTVLVQNPITFTATVSSAVSSPTGTVTFFDGAATTTPIGTGTLAGGVATLIISNLAIGTHSITAVYSGDANFVGGSSSALPEIVQDFNLAISTSSGAGSVTTQTVVPGATANYSFIVSPTGTATFPAAVALSVSGLPPGATYTITPTSIAAGKGPTTVTLAVSVPTQAAANQRKTGPFGNPAAPLTFAVLLLPFARRLRKTSRRLRRVAMLFLLLAGSAIAMAGLSGCGARTGFFAQPQQSYTVTITGSAGSDSHSTSVTLIVE